MRRVACVLVLVLPIGLGCGKGAPLPSAPTEPSPFAPPVQTIVRLNVTARDAGSGARLDAFSRDVVVLFEAGAVCVDVTLACPRPEFVDWRLSGAFCELLGDAHAASVGAICSTTGIVRVEAVMPARGFQAEARGDAQFRVLP